MIIVNHQKLEDDHSQLHTYLRHCVLSGIQKENNVVDSLPKYLYRCWRLLVLVGHWKYSKRPSDERNVREGQGSRILADSELAVEATNLFKPYPYLIPWFETSLRLFLVLQHRHSLLQLDLDELT